MRTVDTRQIDRNVIAKKLKALKADYQEHQVRIKEIKAETARLIALLKESEVPKVGTPGKLMTMPLRTRKSIKMP